MFPAASLSFLKEAEGPMGLSFFSLDLQANQSGWSEGVTAGPSRRFQLKNECFHLILELKHAINMSNFSGSVTMEYGSQRSSERTMRKKRE